MNTPFPEHLRALRTRANLTDAELSELANVPRTFLTSVQTGNRSIGEKQARKIGSALGMSGEELESFVIQAVDSCQHKVLAKYNGYPSEVLNLVARELSRAGIGADAITSCQRASSGVVLVLKDGRKRVIQAQLN